MHLSKHAICNNINDHNNHNNHKNKNNHKNNLNNNNNKNNTNNTDSEASGGFSLATRLHCHKGPTETKTHGQS